jgi:hypothetical protein
VLEEHEPPTRPQDPHDLCERPRLVGHRAQHQRAEHRVDTAVSQGDPLGDTLDDTASMAPRGGCSLEPLVQAGIGL